MFISHHDQIIRYEDDASRFIALMLSNPFTKFLGDMDLYLSLQLLQCMIYSRFTSLSVTQGKRAILQLRER